MALMECGRKLRDVDWPYLRSESIRKPEIPEWLAHAQERVGKHYGVSSMKQEGIQAVKFGSSPIEIAVVIVSNKSTYTAIA